MTANDLWRRIQDAEPDIADLMKADAPRTTEMEWYRRYALTLEELGGAVDPFVVQLLAEMIHHRLIGEE